MREQSLFQPRGHSLPGPDASHLPWVTAWFCLAVPQGAQSSGVTKDCETGRGHSTGKPPCSALGELEVMTQTVQSWPSALPGSVSEGLTSPVGLQGSQFPFLICPSFLAQSSPQSMLLRPKHISQARPQAMLWLQWEPNCLPSHLPQFHACHWATLGTGRALAGFHPSWVCLPSDETLGQHPAPPWVQISNQPVQSGTRDIVSAICCHLPGSFCPCIPPQAPH